ncbi:MAG: M23 family metallopeptidase [Thermomicrobiales bacterium]|nr:M23 family metallopeptidase [Thermomicrobiales bacterium]
MNPPIPSQPMRHARRAALPRLLCTLALAGLLSATAPLSEALGQATPEPVPQTTVAPAAETTALLAKAVDDPLWVVGSDGLVHLEYDLLFTNVSPAPVTLTRIEVLAPGNEPLLALEGDALRAMTQPTSGGAPMTVVPAAGALVTMLDVVLPPGRLPERVGHRITYALPAGAPANTLVTSTQIAWPDLLVEAGPPRVIASPLRGAGWLNTNGCCGPSPHRSARLAIDGSHILDFEAFASDWVKLEGGVTYAGDGARNEDHFAYGEAVFAVASGAVTHVREGVPENTPFTVPPMRSSADYGGNQVVVHLDSGEYASYAHLQPGSVRVQPGDRVVTGDILGLVGNTGHSESPHLHFQLSDGPNHLTSASLPFVIDGWILTGAAPAGATTPTAELVGPEKPQVRTYPMQGAVARFP